MADRQLFNSKNLYNYNYLNCIGTRHLEFNNDFLASLIE